MSAKKGLKQTRLPFQILTSPKVTTPVSTSDSSSKIMISPKTSITKTPVNTKKRKPSSDSENQNATKILRVNSNENIAELDPVEKIDEKVDQAVIDISEDSSNGKINKEEKTPSEEAENSIRIRLPSKRKQTFDTKPRKSLEEIEFDPDDSVVYLDEEELPIKTKKSGKKSEKKNKQKQKSTPTSNSKNETNRVRKSLRLNDSLDEKEISGIEIMEIDDSDNDPVETDKNEEAECLEKQELQPSCATTETAATKSVSAEVSKLIETSSTNENIHDQIVELLSDDVKSPSKKSTANEIVNAEKTTPKLTPKMLARRKELEAKRIEKEQQKQKEREEKEKQRLLEKQMREDAKKKEKEEKEEQRKREKEEREKKKQAELEKKEEEKRQREEEKKKIAEQKEEEKKQKEEEKKRQLDARDEEKKKKEMEKLKEEERKKKAAEAFSKFFQKKNADTSVVMEEEISKDSAESVENAGHFMPFQIRGKMRLAPCVRLQISKNQLDTLDEFLLNNNENESYLKDLKNGKIPKKSGKTWPLEDKDDDEVVVIDELEGVGEDIITNDNNIKCKYRAKLFLFSENRRPAFYGTWRKKSTNVTGRRPFALDKKHFDYEVDSDEEWEEEEPGESLHGSDSEKEKETYDDNYELDDDFFVPHGHLSEEEMKEMNDDMDDNSPEIQKAKLKILQQEFAAEIKKPTEKIKPRLIGCIWMNGDEDEEGCSKGDNLDKKYHCSDIIWRILKAREMMSSGEKIKMEEFEPEIAPEPEDENEEKIVKTPASKKSPPKIDNDSVKEFIKLIHGNLNSKKFIIREFQAYRLKKYHDVPTYQEFSVKSVDEKMNELSEYKTCPEEGPLFGKKCWLVKKDVLKEYFGDEKLPLPNQWMYILEKINKQNNNANSGESSKKNSREASPEENLASKNVNETSQQITDEPQKDLTKETKNGSKKSSAVASPSSKLPFQKKTTSSVVAENKTTTNKEPQKPSSPAQSNSKSNQQNNGKKRVPLLMSVKPGQKINEEKKNSIISLFLKSSTKTNQNENSTTENVDENGVIEIID
ncbi:hypothetical protein PVAND_015308 [Polypedilum vanderplanki]|uniref:Chromatin assembly factor 1 subunit A n=1 Tax=Polypedilum vanderplanki TaxID=319348 RepID=A0A9J6BBW8_POLVA|nr:hypothetical protein PVAND_015308 [Polypedilum vanderplanki]